MVSALLVLSLCESAGQCTLRRRPTRLVVDDCANGSNVTAT
jgi:hypothetical protein